jgi:[phosphatase 2A protein]-leucine-carboxy methyltransferase
MPVINRGTYIRTRAIDLVIDEFLRRFHGEKKKRIVSLGAGSDTRAFKILENNHDGLEYVEFDFTDSTKLKHAIIETDPKLSKVVGLETFQNPSDLAEYYNSIGNSLILEKYKLIDIDLRQNDKVVEVLTKHLDPDVPTLVISECMLCYTESKDSSKLIKTIESFFNKVALLIYDPIGGTDNFGSVMIENLKIRNISMPSLLEFNTLERYSKRLIELGFDEVKSSDVYKVLNDWIGDDEQKRISKLEFLDEIEELKLLLEHYCILIGISGFDWSNFDLSLYTLKK